MNIEFWSSYYFKCGEKYSKRIFTDNNDKEDVPNENVTFTEQDLLQAVNLAQFSYERLKT